MKKIILAVITVFTVGSMHAQQAKFGVKGGLNITTLVGDTEGADIKSLVGFNIGGFAEIKINEKFAVQPELLYSTQGAKFQNAGAYVDGTFYTGDVDFKLSYINIPVMFKYYANEKFSFELGPQIGFLTSAKTKTKLDGFNKTVEQDAKDFFNSVDFGLIFGAGYDFTEHLFVDARYNLGLANIAKTEDGDNSKIKNSVFSVNLGYRF